MTAVRRWRRCPQCMLVAAASEFKTTGTHRPGYGWKQRGRRCPDCGHTVSSRHPACIYCGRVIDMSVFNLE